MKILEKSPEVLVLQDDIVQVSAAEVLNLGPRADASPRRRARLCAHRDSAETLHEMFICLHHETYVRPHKHPGKVESFHIVQGEVDVVILDDDGGIQEVVRLGEFRSAKRFYYRLAIPAYHTVLPRTERAFFHEITNGPFRQGDTLFPDWAPPDDQPAAVAAYLKQLRGRIDQEAAA